MSSSKPIEPFNLEILNERNYEQDSNEPPVVEEVFEHVEISLTNLSAVDLIGQLHEDKCAEDECEES